jgi:hypothetical protein
MPLPGTPTSEALLVPLINIGTFSFSPTEHLLASTVHAFVYDAHMTLITAAVTRSLATPRIAPQPPIQGLLLRTLARIKLTVWRRSEPVVLHYHGVRL